LCQVVVVAIQINKAKRKQQQRYLLRSGLNEYLHQGEEPILIGSNRGFLYRYRKEKGGVITVVFTMTKSLNLLGEMHFPEHLLSHVPRKEEK